MTLHPNMVKQIEACKTAKQVLDLLDENKIEVVKDDSDEVDSFSIWLDETTRIYQPYKSKTMKVQTWSKINMVYSGIPVYFGH